MPKYPLTVDSRTSLPPAGIPKSLFYISNVRISCVDVLVRRARLASITSCMFPGMLTVIACIAHVKEKNVHFYPCLAGLVKGKRFMAANKVKRFE